LSVDDERCCGRGQTDCCGLDLSAGLLQLGQARVTEGDFGSGCGALLAPRRGVLDSNT
jgi:hypothetical protein